jgi:hypothetical protein
MDGTMALFTEIGRKGTNRRGAAAAAAAVLLAQLVAVVTPPCWIVLPVCSRIRALHGPLWACLINKTLFVIIKVYY